MATIAKDKTTKKNRTAVYTEYTQTFRKRQNHGTQNHECRLAFHDSVRMILFPPVFFGVFRVFRGLFFWFWLRRVRISGFSFVTACVRVVPCSRRVVPFPYRAAAECVKVRAQQIYEIDQTTPWT